MGKSIAQLITDGEAPVRPYLTDNADRLAWERQVADHYIAYCRDHTRTWIYVDSIGGSDSNDGLSIDTPKQTMTAAVALLAPNYGIRAKRGSVFKSQAVTLDEAGSALVPYGVGANPLLWRPALITGTWTNTTGAQWSITVPDSDTALVLVGDPDDPAQVETMRNQPYQRVTSTTGMAAGTYHQTGTTLTVRLYGDVDPNTVEVWRAHRTATLPAASGIEITNVDRVYVNGIDVIGFGSDISGQLYNIRSNAQGTSVHAIVGCNAHYVTSHHDMGVYVSGLGQSGGITVWKGNTYGYCTHDSSGLSTIFVNYVITGGQTMFFHDNLCDGGQIGYAANGAGTNAINNTFPIYMHTNGVAKATYFSLVGNRTKTRAGNKIGKPFATDLNTLTVPTARFDFDQYTCIVMDEVYDEGQIPTGNFVGFSQVEGVARVGYKWGDLLLTEAGANSGAMLGPWKGGFVNGEVNFIIDSAEAAEFFGVLYGGVNPYLTSCWGAYNHTRITWTGNPGTAPAKYFSASAVGSVNQYYGCIFGYANLSDPTGSTFTANQLYAAENATPAYTGASGTGGFSQCGFYRTNPTTGGFASSHDPLNLSVAHGIGTTHPLIPFGTAPEATSPLVGHADAPPTALAFTHDIDGVERTLSTLGPREVQTDSGFSAATFIAFRKRRSEGLTIGGISP